MLLEISHQTIFAYSQPVMESYVELRLTPLTDASQYLLQHRPRVSPSRPIDQYADFLGNIVSYFCLVAPHDRVETVFESVVETYPVRYRGQELQDPMRPTPAERLQLYDFVRPTALTSPCPAFYDFVRPLEALRGAGVEEIARTVKERIYTGFRYEGDVTSASSPIDDLLRHGGGVCQDFTHLMLATARFLEVPARYVSGYVLPEGSGEQVVESHAWCELFDPEHGWFGVDPTHNEWADERHVRLGVGRDFRDVPPNRGVFRGLAVEELQVTVRIRPINADQLGVRTRTLVAGPRVAAPRGRQLRKPQPVSILQQTLYAQQQQQQQ